MLTISESERRKQVATDLALKLKLEPPLARAMRSFFAEVRKDFVSTYSHGHGLLTFEKEYEADVTAILKKHYRRVVRVFGARFRGQMNKKSYAFPLTNYKKKNAIDHAIGAAIAVYLLARAAKQAKYIIATTTKEFMASIKNVLKAAQEHGETMTRAEIAKAVASDVKPSQDARADTISVTETQNMAERTKYTEASMLAEAGATIDGVSMKDDMNKQWDAILDDVTREAHAEADGERRETDDPFDVGLDQMMFPGDDSLGADLSNIINCRCGVSYTAAPPNDQDDE